MSIKISAVIFVAALGFSGCAANLLQSARPVEKGKTEFFIAPAVSYNGLVKERGLVVDNAALQLGMRLGVKDNVDIGVRSFLGLGALLEGKYNFMPQESPWALSLRAGFGGGSYGYGERLWHAPLGVLASYDHGALTPYGGVTYGAYWIYGREPNSIDPDLTYAPRKGHGDGLLHLTGGLKWMFASWVGLVIDYTGLVPVVNDPGDFYRFKTTHQAALGLVFVAGPTAGKKSSPE